ncbi:MAG: oligosaccharide flippase family protein [Lysobacteraceae bacterium]
MAARLSPAAFVPERLWRPLWHVSMLTVAMVAGVAMAFATQTLLARELGPADYGLFASSLATVTMIAPLAGFGLTQFRLKVYGVEGWAAHRWMQPSLRFTVFSTLLAIGLVVGWALLGAPANGTRFCLLVLTPVIFSVLASDLVGNKLRLEDRYRYMALWQLMLPASRLAVAIALWWVVGLGYRFVAVAYAVVALLVTARALPHLRALLRDEMDLKGHGRRDLAAPAGPTPGVAEVWSQAWAYGLVALLFPVFFQISTVLLKYLDNDTQAGHYGIALSVMTAIYMIPVTIYQKFLLAKLHRWAAHDKPKFWLVYRKGNYAMFAFGLLIALVLAGLAPWVVPLVFGKAYRPVVAILMVLAWCVPLRFLAVSAGSVLLTENHMRYRVFALALAATTVVLLNLALIPRFHALGAAGATVIGEGVLLLSTAFFVRRFVLPMREPATVETAPC